MLMLIYLRVVSNYEETGGVSISGLNTNTAGHKQVFCGLK